jgi:hypothetical protein
MRGVMRRIDEWGTARPWLVASCTWLFLALLLIMIGSVLNNTHEWWYAILFSLPFALGTGVSFQAQRRRQNQR